MICPECGTRLPKGKDECHFCGYTYTEKLVESSVKNDDKSECLPNSTINDSNFIDKFTALFALLALFIALIVYLSGYVENIGKDLVPNAAIRGGISVAIAAILTFFYWLLSPLLIRTLIDSQKPFSGNIWEVFILLGVYFLAVGLNFSIIPPVISLVTFIVLSIIFAGLYQYLSHNPVLIKK